MFKIFISGRTMEELRSNIQAFLNGTIQSVSNDSNDVTFGGQVFAPNIPAAPAPVSVPTIAHIPAQPAQVGMPSVPKPAPAAAEAPKPPSMEFGLDSRGIPWDERIHAVTQGVNKDGSWRLRRGVESAFVEQVEAELKAKVSAMGLTPVIPFAPHPPTAAFPQGVPARVAPAPNEPPFPPSVPVAPVVPPPVVAPTPVLPSAHTVQTFKANMPMVLAALVKEGKLTQEYIQTLKNYFGVDEIWRVNDEQTAEMFENFAQNGLIAKAP